MPKVTDYFNKPLNLLPNYFKKIGLGFILASVVFVVSVKISGIHLSVEKKRNDENYFERCCPAWNDVYCIFQREGWRWIDNAYKNEGFSLGICLYCNFQNCQRCFWHYRPRTHWKYEWVFFSNDDLVFFCLLLCKIVTLTLRNRIKIERAIMNITQQELAEKLGVSRQTINSIESNRYIPSTTLAIKLSNW